ncbi:MAG: MraY family glycosyltransferase [Opitutales bacterium]
MNPVIVILLLVGFLMSLATAWVVTALLKHYAPKLGWMDEPDYRKVHETPIPRLGGIGIFCGFSAGLFFFGLIGFVFPNSESAVAVSDALPSRFFLVGTFMVGLLGLVDDIKGIDFKQKLVFQCLISVFMVLAGYRFAPDFTVFTALAPYAEYICIPLTFLWIIGVMNALNLIDGLDGLAGGLSLIAITTVSLCCLALGAGLEIALFLAMAGALLGFLRHNYHPASIFMGDTGSLFLGFVVSTYALSTTQQVGNPLLFFLPILAVLVPVFDTLSSMARRKLRGRPMFYPDRDHIHHRLRYRIGLSHKNSVLALYAMAAVFGSLAFLVALLPPTLGAIALAGAFVFLAIVMRRLQYLDYKSWKAARERARRAQERPGLRLVGLTGKNVRWDPPRAKPEEPRGFLGSLLRRP